MSSNVDTFHNHGKVTKTKILTLINTTLLTKLQTLCVFSQLFHKPPSFSVPGPNPGLPIAFRESIDVFFPFTQGHFFHGLFLLWRENEREREKH